jgi:chromosome segregation ATPase
VLAVLLQQVALAQAQRAAEATQEAVRAEAEAERVALVGELQAVKDKLKAAEASRKEGLSALDALHAKVYDLQEQLAAAESVAAQQLAAMDSMQNMQVRAIVCVGSAVSAQLTQVKRTWVRSASLTAVVGASWGCPLRFATQANVQHWQACVKQALSEHAACVISPWLLCEVRSVEVADRRRAAGGSSRGAGQGGGQEDG